ncbi:MAG: peroxide stress protein YaaA [Rhodoglobus sp.]|nr:peroxide stress protein YaaA [Rhodoglobus sp.]
MLDLRSESYAALGPAPASAFSLRVVSEDERGRRVALSHFNKHAKGQFARAVISAGIDHGSVDSLLAWAVASGIRLEPGAEGELELVA